LKSCPIAGLFYFHGMTKYLVAGLGNIGADYEHTRHNIGFDVLDAFAAKHAISFRIDRLAEVAEVKIKGRQVFCIKPSTYMNLSGKAVKYWKEKEHIETENILVILDDVALGLEKMRIRPGGSDGGHNGLKSIQEALLTDQYPRLRFGVGNDYPKGRQAEYVLGRWKSSEEALVQKKIALSVDAIEQVVLQGVSPTMNQFNKLNITL
jgi:PTH1 family peptidyl-tRNA hydrolase